MSIISAIKTGFASARAKAMIPNGNVVRLSEDFIVSKELIPAAAEWLRRNHPDTSAIDIMNMEIRFRYGGDAQNFKRWKKAFGLTASHPYMINLTGSYEYARCLQIQAGRDEYTMRAHAMDCMCHADDDASELYDRIRERIEASYPYLASSDYRLAGGYILFPDIKYVRVFAKFFDDLIEQTH